MASMEDICDQLGYSKHVPRSRGYPNLLRGDLQSFSERMSWFRDVESLADLYLCENGSRRFPYSRSHLIYPGDRGGIRVLIVQAFRLLRGIVLEEDTTDISTSHAADAASSTTVDKQRMLLERDGTAEPELTAVSVNQRPESTMTGSTSQPTRQLDYAVATSTGPVTAQSKKELVAVIKEWIDVHPEQRFPEVGRYDGFSFESIFAVEASLTATDERIWVTRIGIVEQYLGWVLETPEGSYMLVTTSYTRSRGHGYYAWLGGDLGFSDDEVAHHRDVPKKKFSRRGYARKRGLDAEDVLNDSDISKYDLENKVPQSISKKVPQATAKKVSANHIPAAEDSDSSLTSLSELVPLMNAWKKRRAEEPLSQPSRKRQLSTRLKAVKLEPEGKTSQITAPETPQHPSALRNSFSTATTRLRQAPTSHLNSSPPTATTTTSIPPALLPFNNNNNSNVLQTPPPSIPPPTTTLGTPFTFTTPTTTAKDVTFHFFLADPILGAIPHTFPPTALPSKLKFFNSAIAAYETVLPVQPKTEVVAASVRVGGVARPIVVRRDGAGKAAWDEVGRVVVREVVAGKEGGGGRVEVEVRCIVGGGGGGG